MKTHNNVKKYEIWLVDLEPVVGSEQAGIRPCLIVHNNIFFSKQNTALVLPITSKNKKQGRFRILIEKFKKVGLTKPSIILSFQIRTADKSRFKKKLGKITSNKLKEKIKDSLILSLDLDDEFENE